MEISLGTKRLFVLILSIILTVQSILAINDCHQDTVCLVLSALIIAGSIFGVIGAWNVNQKLLGYFLLVLTGLIAFQVIWIIMKIVHNVDVHTLINDIARLIILILGAVATANLRGHRDVYSAIPDIL
jgi:hypothetical protein